MERRILSGCRPRRGLSALDLLDDAVEVGVHVGILGRVELAFDGREVLDSGLFSLFCCGFRRGCVRCLGVQIHAAIICQQCEQENCGCC